MKLTIAIPTFQKEHTIERCLKSALAQQPFVDEILVIDNCSSDRTWEIAQKFQPQIRCVKNSRNLGMAGNWNRCVELCHTDLLMILHADDELLPGAAKLYLDFFTQYPEISFAHADFYYVRGDDYTTQWLQSVDRQPVRQAGEEFLGMGGNACSTVVVKTEVYKALGGFIESLSSDVEMWYRIGAHYNTGHIDKPTAMIHLYSDSTGGNSLTKRTLTEIERDITQLSDRIASWYPRSAQPFLQKQKEQGLADTLIMVFAKSLKAGKLFRAMHALWIVIIKYRGFGLFVRRMWGMVKYRVSLLTNKKPRQQPG